MNTTNRLQLESQLRDARNEEIERRTTAHNLEVRRNKIGNRRRSAVGKAPRAIPLDLLAIGDSWFDYPLNDYGHFSSNQDIIGEPGTQLQSMGNPPPMILSYALFGSLSTAMLTYERQEQILSALTDPSTTQWNNGVTADGILASAGGNDVVGDSFAIYLDYRVGGLDNDRFQGILASVQASYLDLFALRVISRLQRSESILNRYPSSVTATTMRSRTERRLGSLFHLQDPGFALR